VNPDTTAQQLLVSLPEDTEPDYQFAIAPNGDVFVESRGGLGKLAAGNTTFTPLLSPPAEPFYVNELAIAPSGDVLLLQANGYDSRLLRVDPATGASTVLASGDALPWAEDIAVAPGGDVVVSAACWQGSSLIHAFVRVSPRGEVSCLPQPWQPQARIAVTPTDDIIVASQDGLLRVNSRSGSAASITREGYRSVVVDPLGEILAVNGYSVQRIDPASGLGSPVTYFPWPSGIVVTSDGDILTAQGS